MPMGIYAGDPDNYPEQMGLPDDSDIPDASEFNVANENSGDRTAMIRARSRGAAGSTWPYPALATSFGVYGVWSRVVYNSWLNQFVVSVRDTGNAYLLFLPVGGSAAGAVSPTYAVVASIDHPAGAVIVNPTNGDIAIYSNTVKGVLKMSTGAWAGITTATGVTLQNSEGRFFNSLFVAVSGAHIASSALTFAKSADGITWTTTSFAVSGFRFLPANMVHCHGTQEQVICLGDENATTNYVYTLDGSTWFTNAVPVVLASDERVIGACWDTPCQKANGGIFGGLVVCTFSPTNGTKVYINWQLVKTFATSIAYGVFTNQGEIIVQLKKSYFGGSGLLAGYPLVRSIDNGATWQLSPLAAGGEPVVETNSSNSCQTRYSIGGGGGAFFYLNQSGANGSSNNDAHGSSSSTGYAPTFLG